MEETKLFSGSEVGGFTHPVRGNGALAQKGQIGQTRTGRYGDDMDLPTQPFNGLHPPGLVVQEVTIRGK